MLSIRKKAFIEIGTQYEQKHEQKEKRPVRDELNNRHHGYFRRLNEEST